jgi:hypothetical protein
MEPIRKRQKLATEQQRSLLDQPDSFIKFVVSFLDFQSLLAFRQTSHRFKRIAEEDMRRRALEALPVDCEHESYNGERSDEASLRLGWSDKFRDRDAVFETALSRADPGGQVSLDADYDEEIARALLYDRGWVDVEDFLGNSDADGDEDDYYGGEVGWGGDLPNSEVGWRVSASFQSISLKDKWNFAKSLMINQDEANGPVLRDEDEANGLVLRQCAFGLLLDAQPSSLRYAYAKYAYRHTDYPGGGKDEALLFLTTDGTRVQLERSNHYDVC